MTSSGSPNVDGLKGASEADSISAIVGGFPRGPFREMTGNRLRAYLAIMSILPSFCAICEVMNVRKWSSKFFEGGKVISKTQRSCHPLNVLSLSINRIRLGRKNTRERDVQSRTALQLLNDLTIDLISHLAP